jgi:GDP-L-fucose synthase
MSSHINIGTGVDSSIRELAETIARVTGFTGKLEFDASRPDGTPRKLLDVSRLSALGWRASIGLEAGLRQTYDWYLRHLSMARH